MKSRLRFGRTTFVFAICALVVAAGAWAFVSLGAHRPPSIFDSPADDLVGYLVSDDFSRLSVEERMKFIAEVIERFRGMSQSESAVVAAFFAGLSGPAREQLRQNVRILGKDILVQGAEGYLSINDEAARRAYLDQWLVKWARFADQLDGRPSQRTDQEILARLRRDAERDAKEGFELNAGSAQQLLDFWQRDVARVAGPREQGQIFRFLPDLQKHLLEPR